MASQPVPLPSPPCLRLFVPVASSLKPVAFAQRAHAPHAQRKKKGWRAAAAGGTRGNYTLYLIKASLLAGEPLRPSSDNTRRQALRCKMLL